MGEQEEKQVDIGNRKCTVAHSNRSPCFQMGLEPSCYHCGGLQPEQAACPCDQQAVPLVHHWHDWDWTMS